MCVFSSFIFVLKFQKDAPFLKILKN